MTGKRSVSLAPTPAEMALMVFAAYFLWFIADGVKGIVAGVSGVAAGIVLSRLVGLVGPRQRNLGRAVWLLVALGFVIGAPFLASGDFRTSQMAIAGYTAIGVLGLNILTGYAGQASIGHSAFLGLGGYGTAIMVNEWHASFILAIAVGTLVAALAGLIIGVPALRLSGPYLAIATLGLAVVFTPIMKLQELADLTGGRGGLNLFQHEFGPPVHWGWLTDARWYYFATMFSLGAAVLMAHNLLQSAAGRAFRAVRDGETAAAAMGVNVPLTKLTAFAISSAYAGFAGGLLFLLSNRFVSPESFTVIMAIEFLVAMVIGGMASIPGSLIGAFFLVYVYRVGLETVSRQTEAGSDAWLLIAGTLIAASILFSSGWISAQTRKYGARLSAQYGEAALNAVKLAAAVALGVAFTWLLRKAAEDLLDLVALRGAITGAFLILIVVFLPGGVAWLLGSIQKLTWREMYGWLRGKLGPSSREGAAEVPEASGAPR